MVTNLELERRIFENNDVRLHGKHVGPLATQSDQAMREWAARDVIATVTMTLHADGHYKAEVPDALRGHVYGFSVWRGDDLIGAWPGYVNPDQHTVGVLIGDPPLSAV